jgi:hypothetical protein
LTQCDDAIVREGVCAYLADALEKATARRAARATQGWTSYQMADERVVQRMGELADTLAEYRDAGRRQAALERFHQYAYQWY